MKPARIKRQVSAGGVVFRREDGTVRVVLVSVKNGSVWTLPKGLVEKGEDREVAALREVREETGVEATIMAPLGSISYWYYMKKENTKYHKTVYYYLMEYVSGSVSEHDWEVNEARWFDLDEALQRVTYRGDREVLLRAKEVLSG